MKTLGIDPGTAILGWGVVEERGDTRVALGYGVLRTTPDMAQHERLLSLYRELSALIAEHRPDEAAVEELFFGKNVNTALTVGQARGVVLLALAQVGIPIFEYKPLVVKQAIVGYGGAEKRQMQEMVKMTLGLDSIPKPDDAADALAVALCHSFSAPALRRMQDR